MKRIEENILENARILFNTKGVADISIREVSRSLGISHSNLIYHFKNKNILIERLHEKIFESALELNKLVAHEPPLRGLFITTCSGFETLYQYRFFMIDLVWIFRENKALHTRFLEVEKHRFLMYQAKIKELIDSDILKKMEDISVYEILIHQVKVFSDTWLSQAVIYEKDIEASIPKYCLWFLMLFYPYLSENGVREFHKYKKEFFGVL